MVSMHLSFFYKKNAPQWIVAIPLVLFAAWYFREYFHFSARPGNNPLNPLGWLGWFDQGQYLRAENAIGRLDLTATEHHYPPLYPLLAYIGGIFYKSEKFFTIDLVCFVIYMASLLSTGARVYGRVIWAVPIAIFYFYPDVTLDQWVIPWTTSLSAALQGIMVAIYVGFDDRAKKFVVNSKSDLAFVFVFFLVYGAIFPTRPLEVFVFFRWH